MPIPELIALWAEVWQALLSARCQWLGCSLEALEKHLLPGSFSLSQNSDPGSCRTEVLASLLVGSHSQLLEAPLWWQVAPSIFTASSGLPNPSML